MPTHVRAMCQWNVNTMLPKDVMQITPCFRVSTVLPQTDEGWQTLADDLAAGLNGWQAQPTANTLTVKLYDLDDDTRPNRPRATAVRAPGQSGAPDVFRELAICLSFNGGENSPRQRGRLYVPYVMVDPSPTVRLRPSLANRQKVADLVPILTGLGGINVDWIVWSPTNGSATAVERWYVDDEWDIQRRRELGPSARLAGTTSE
jgi:hypothetical protein